MNRPIVSEYNDLPLFIADMISYLKATVRGFSVLRETKKLRKVSPALVSLIIQKKRKITADRARELAILLKLTAQEKVYFRDWIERLEFGEAHSEEAKRTTKRKKSASHLLKDWINAFVKDAFQIERVRRNQNELYSILAGIASQKRIDKAIDFLLREGYLKRTPEGQLVEDVELNVVDHNIPDSQVKKFHKGVLKTAIKAIDQYPTNRRFANALILTLNQQKYEELTEIIQDFAIKLQHFAEKNEGGTGLYQLVINLSPTGGNHE